MEILKQLFSNFKELLYDVLGYLLPGYLVLFILYLPFIANDCSSPMYSLLEIFFKYNKNLKLTNLFQNFSFLMILIMSFVAYLLGHIPIYLSDPLGKRLNSVLKKFRPEKSRDCEKAEIIFANVFNTLEKKFNFPKDLFYSVNKYNELELNKDIVKTIASTYSRFSSHDDLIQKYTYKVNFYNSLSCIFFIMFVDAFISSFIRVSFNSYMYTPSVLARLFAFNLFLLLCFLAFFPSIKDILILKLKNVIFSYLNIFNLIIGYLL